MSGRGFWMVVLCLFVKIHVQANDVVHVYTAAIIQAAVILRLPNIMMADEIREDFASSFEIISRMSQGSALAQRALPVLLRIKKRLDVNVASWQESTDDTAQSWAEQR
jgi:hypothetical protein